MADFVLGSLVLQVISHLVALANLDHERLFGVRVQEFADDLRGSKSPHLGVADMAVGFSSGTETNRYDVEAKSCVGKVGNFAVFWQSVVDSDVWARVELLRPDRR